MALFLGLALRLTARISGVGAEALTDESANILTDESGNNLMSSGA